MRALVAGSVLFSFVALAGPLTPGALAPDFTLPRAWGGALTLSSLQGRVVLVDFWATWCPPCRQELPWLAKLAAKFQSRGLQFVAVNQDHPAAQRLAFEAFSPSLPELARWTVFGTPEVFAAWHGDGLPLLVLLDREGRVIAAQEGLTDEASVTRAVERALAGR